MIQRIQSIYLLLAGAMQAYIVSGLLKANNILKAPIEAYLLFFSLMLCFTAIFVYKKMGVQLSILRVAILLSSIDLILLVYQTFFSAQVAAESDAILWWELLMLFVSMVFITMAVRSIRKDSMIVKGARSFR